MEDFRALYKVGKTGKLRGEKRETARREQKKKREDTFLERRNIRADQQQPSTSAASSPAVANKKQETRLEKLLRWKAEKEKLVAQLKKIEKKKPPFRAGLAHHPIDPNQELKEVHATAVKCATQKKVAAESRLGAAEKRKANQPTAASSSLAALSSTAAAPTTSAAFSGRVTRSRTAAAASSKPTVNPKAKKLETKAVKDTKTTSSTSSARSNTTTRAAASRQVKAPQRQAAVSKPVNRNHETSFAPKDHKFKAPSSLTLPTTPLMLKRKAAGAKEAGWPSIAGVSVLSSSPGEPSPKVPRSTRTVASQRRGTLSRAVKEKTPKKTPKVAAAPSPKMPRSNRKSGKGMFIVTDMPDSTPSKPKEAEVSTNIVSEPPVRERSSRKSIGPSTPTASNKKRQSVRGKENVPAISNGTVDTEEFSAIILPEIDEMELVTSSRRMSIHDPSPPVHISPEKLSSGLVPAQFSPFITSARGKDKYSTQKRRSSLIPVPQELSTEELVKTRQTEHFRNMLEREASRLSALSEVWEKRMEDAPPVAQDKILGAVGQARLLVKDKFQQFKRLVDKFEMGSSEGKITSEDLTGFWEMMLLTVDNVDKRFKELEDFKENNWQEKETTLPAKKIVPIAAAASKAAKPKNQVQSRLKDLIEAARKKKLECKQNKSANTTTAPIVPSDVATFDGGFFRVESPKKVLPSPKPKSASPARRSPQVMLTTPRQFHRRSLLQKVLTHSAVRAHQSPISSPLNKSLPLSPSPKVVVAQLRASELGKRMSMDTSISDDVFTQSPSSPVLKAEPTKSILKSARKSLRINTPRNRVAFENLNCSENSSPGSPMLSSPVMTPPSKTTAKRVSTPGVRRSSLIPRPISTPKGDRPSLMPMRESLVPTKPLSNGELIDFDSPTLDLLSS